MTIRFKNPCRCAGDLSPRAAAAITRRLTAAAMRAVTMIPPPPPRTGAVHDPSARAVPGTVAAHPEPPARSFGAQSRLVGKAITGSQPIARGERRRADGEGVHE